MKKTQLLSIIFTTFLLSFFVCLLESCNSGNDKLELALELAGDNKGELQKVLDHYKQNPADSLKYRAACFLIENMPYHFSYDTTHLHLYRPVIDTINLLRTKGYSKSTIKKRVNPILDSLIALYPLSCIYSKTGDDLTSVRSGFLINNIEQAFEGYNKNPFKDSILFEDFLEYALPYRIQNGYSLEEWRPYFINNYAVNNQENFTSVHQFCDSLLYNFKDVKIAWRVADQYPYLKLDDYLKSKMTHCPQKCWFNCMLLRSFGIPITVDFVPVTRVHTHGHEWTSVKLKNDIYFFDAFWEGIGKEQMPDLKAYYGREKDHPVIGPIQLPKIYRKTYKMNVSELLNDAIKTGEDIPPFFRTPFLKDVTREYFKTYNIESPVIKKIKGVDYAYACIIGKKQNWVPVDFGEIKKGKVIFKSLGSKNVYLPAFYKFNSLIPAAYPVLLKEDGTPLILCPDTTRLRNIEVSHVGYQRPELKDYMESFIGAFVEGSNNKNFRKSEILCQFNKLYEPGTYYTAINTDSKYRYIRFVLPQQKIVLNEIKFFNKGSGSEEEVKGKLICSQPKDSSLFQRIIDGDLITGANFKSLSEEPYYKSEFWIGYDFKRPILINGFEFYYVFGTSIRKNGTYELLYWDFGWKSLGIKKSNSTYPIYFDDVPENTLLMIKIHDTDSYSRPFTYSEEKQHWW